MAVLTLNLTFRRYISDYEHDYKPLRNVFTMSKDIIRFKGFTFDVNKHISKTITKKEIAQQAAEDDIELSSKILQTIFTIRTDESSVDLLSASSDEVELLCKKVKYPNNFTILSKPILVYMCTADDATKTLICYIAANIEYGSNKIEIKEDILNRTTLTYKRLKVAIHNLIEKEYIASTTKKGLYVVNHNHIFYGDYNKFIRVYVKLYRKALKPETTYNGKKIILPEDYGKQ